MINKNTQQQYFDAVKKLRRQNDSIHSIEALEQLATQLGMSQEAWKKLQKEFQDSLTRGKGFMQYKNWEDATEELQKAEQINPYHLSVLMELSESHKQLWLQNHAPLDEDLAEEYAKRCLQIQPNHQRSLQLISSLKTPHNSTSTTTSKDTWKKWMALALLLLLIGSVLVYQLSTNSTTNNKGTQTTENPETEDEFLDYGNLKVEVRYDKKNQGLKWIIDDSYLQEFEASFGYTLKMYVLPLQVELQRLKIKITLMDENRKPLYSQERKIVSDESYVQGDFIPVVLTLYNEVKSMPNIALAEISVEDIKHDVFSKSYPSSEKSYTWGIKPPDPSIMRLEIRERQSKLTPSFNKKSCYHKLILEIINRGKFPIKELKIGVSWVDHDPKMVQAKETIVVSKSSTPTLKPGQKYIMNRTFEVKGYTPEMLQSFGLSVMGLEY